MSWKSHNNVYFEFTFFKVRLPFLHISHAKNGCRDGLQYVSTAIYNQTCKAESLYHYLHPPRIQIPTLRSGILRGSLLIKWTEVNMLRYFSNTFPTAIFSIT